MNNLTILEILSNKGIWVIFAICFFLGLFLGWFFRKGSIVWMIIGLILFAPLLDYFIYHDLWIFTIPFSLGFLVHTAIPLWLKITS